MARAPRPHPGWTRSASRATGSRRVAVHPPLATMHALDLSHWRAVHGLDHLVVRELARDGDWGLNCTLRLSGGLGSWLPGPDVELVIATWGATLCTLEARGWWGATWTLLANVEEEPGC